MKSELSYKELQEQGVFNVPYRAFEFMQEQQAKINELQSKLDEQHKVIDEVFTIIHNAYMSYENENLETVYDKIKDLLK